MATPMVNTETLGHTMRYTNVKVDNKEFVNRPVIPVDSCAITAWAYIRLIIRIHVTAVLAYGNS